MSTILKKLLEKKKNFIFVGEAGSGKSEIAINFALKMAKISEKKVHFFDMDQTKPLFRSRDVIDVIEGGGVIFHHDEQFYDAPTIVGGVRVQLQDPNSIVVMDVGGNNTGARLIGGFSPLFNRDETQNYFVINPYRPWSKDVLSIDGTLSSILKVSHINLDNVSVISNPNVGRDTDIDEIIEGNKKVEDMVGEFINIDYMCAMEKFADEIKERADIPLIPINLYLTHLWGS